LAGDMKWLEPFGVVKKKIFAERKEWKKKVLLRRSFGETKKGEKINLKFRGKKNKLT